MDLDVEVSQVVFVRNGTDARYTERPKSVNGYGSIERVLRQYLRLGHQPFRLLDDPLGERHIDTKSQLNSAGIEDRKTV